MAASVSSRVWVLRWLLGAFAHWVWLRQRRYDDGFVTYTWQSTLTSASSMFFPFLLILSLATSFPSSGSLSLPGCLHSSCTSFFRWIFRLFRLCVHVHISFFLHSISFYYIECGDTRTSLLLTLSLQHWMEYIQRNNNIILFSFLLPSHLREHTHPTASANTPCTQITQRDAICTMRVCVPVCLCAWVLVCVQCV